VWLAFYKEEAEMDKDTIQLVIDALKEEKIDLVATLPETPTSPLIEAIRRDPYFTFISVAGKPGGDCL